LFVTSRFVHESLRCASFFDHINVDTQLVENEDTIGTLIETNERIIAALEMYDTVRSNVRTPPPRRL